MKQLEGKVAIVSGGTKGIGYAISSTLAAQGARVVMVGTDRTAAEKAAVEIAAQGGTVLPVAADLTTEEGRTAVLRETLNAYSKVDILINNAGWGCKTSFLETTMEGFDRSINLNLKGTYFMTQAVAAQMVAQGTGGRIVNISSTAALQGERNSTIYSATKAGIMAFTRALALEMGPYGINVNCVAPGFTRTNNNGHVPASIDENFLAITPTQRITVAQDIANACLFLVSDGASQITAQVLSVDGGYSGTRAMQAAQTASMQRK